MLQSIVRSNPEGPTARTAHEQTWPAVAKVPFLNRLDEADATDDRDRTRKLPPLDCGGCSDPGRHDLRPEPEGRHEASEGVSASRGYRTDGTGRAFSEAAHHPVRRCVSACPARTASTTDVRAPGEIQPDDLDRITARAQSARWQTNRPTRRRVTGRVSPAGRRQTVTPSTSPVWRNSSSRTSSRFTDSASSTGPPMTRRWRRGKTGSSSSTSPPSGCRTTTSTLSPSRSTGTAKGRGTSRTTRPG